MYLEAKGIHKSFGKVNVLKGIDLEVAKGEIVAIAGMSGAGKTTLLQILGTLDRPDSGRLLLQDRDLTRIADKEMSRLRNLEIGFVFQFHHLLPEFTALENICMPAFISGANRRQAEKRAEELLGYLKLTHRKDHKPAALSGGEQQRVAVARALVNHPSVILADEPSGNLDSVNALELHELFLKLRVDLGQTFIIVTHNKELAGMADRVLEMRDGVFL